LRISATTAPSSLICGIAPPPSRDDATTTTMGGGCHVAAVGEGGGGGAGRRDDRPPPSTTPRRGNTPVTSPNSPRRTCARRRACSCGCACPRPPITCPRTSSSRRDATARRAWDARCTSIGISTPRTCRKSRNASTS
jgi:hypothetical protein